MKCIKRSINTDFDNTDMDTKNRKSISRYDFTDINKTRYFTEPSR